MRRRDGMAAAGVAPVAPAASAAREVPTLETLAWLRGAIGKRGQGLVALLCVLNALSALLAVCLAPIMQQAVDAATSGAPGRFGHLMLLFAGVIALQIALRAWFRHVAELSRATLDNRLRGRVFSNVLAMPARETEELHSAAVMSRMTSDVQVVTGAVTSLAPNMLSAGIRLVGVLLVMYALAAPLAAIFMLVGIGMVGVSAALRRVLKRRHRDVQEAESAMRCFIQDCLDSLLVIRTFGVDAKMVARNDADMDEHLRQRMRKNAVSNVASTGFSLAVQGGYVLGFAWCGYGILAGTLTYGTLVAVIQLVGQIQAPIANLGGMFSTWASLLSSAERLMEMAGDGKRRAGTAGDASTPVPVRPAGVPTDAAGLYAELKCIRFADVSFRYDPDKPALEGLDLAIVPGSFTAIAGPSGVGKSTLMKLLLAVYVPDAGAVALEGVSPEGSRWSCSPAEVPAGLFAYVPQGNRLMAGTVREAVALAEQGPQPDETRVREALRIACADGFVAELPDGIDTHLGEHGAGLSEGQQQRLAVARAVYSEAPILLLDEATSALDAATERQMLENLRALPGRTLVIVTHRAEVMDLCDAVVHMEEGRVA